MAPAAAPTNPVTAGLVIDLVARGQADTVTTWTDSSPGGAGAAMFTTGSAKAVRADNATPAGGPAVRFTDAGYSTGNAHAFDAATSGEMFAVVRDGGSNSFHGFYQLGGNSPTYYNFSNYIFDGSFTTSNYAFGVPGLTDWHVYNVSHDGTTRTTRIDGQVVHSVAVGFTPPPASSYPTILVGSPGWTGDVAEFATYTRSLSDPERAQVYDYLRSAHLLAATPAVELPAITVTVSPGLTEGAAPARLLLGLAAGNLAGVDGSAVNTWASTPAGGLGDAVLTSGTAATYRRAQTPAGGPVVRFADAQYTLQNTAALDASTSAEFFAVLRTDGSTGNGPGFYQFGGSDYTYYTFGDGNLYDGSFTSTRFSFPLATPADWHVYNVSHDGTTRTARIDGQVVHTATVGFTAPSRSGLPVCLLGRQYTNYPWHGDIAEIRTYDRSLSTTERDQVYASLRATHLTAGATPAAALVCPPIAVLVGVGPGVAGDPVPRLLMPALAVQVLAPAGTVTEPVTVVLPPVAVTAGAGVPVEGAGRTVLACPPADAGVDASAPVSVTGTAVPLTPQGIVVPGARPAFTVTVTNDTSGLQVQAQWSTDPTLTTGTADAFTDAPAGLDAAMATLQAGTALPDGVWWWRARLAGPFGPGVWSDPVRFAVDTTEGQAVAAGDLTVTTGAVGAPHLWFIDPEATGTGPGDDAVIAGTGFGDQPAVMLGTVACTVTGIEQVPAADLPAAGDRQIVPGGPVTPAHQVLTFTIPDVGPDHVGDALTVQRS